MKQMLLFIFLLFAASCSTTTEEPCPEIFIPRETTRLYQNNGRFDEFQINLVGTESFCYTNPSNNRRYAAITPIFRIRRLENSRTTNIDADFYVKTSINSEDYIGTRRFSQTLTIPQNEKEITVKGRQTINRIANPPYDKFTISVGMVMSEGAKSKAKGMFDINYRYLTEEDIAEAEKSAVDTVYLEVGTDEEVIYSDYDKKPVVVKKDRPKNNCKN